MQRREFIALVGGAAAACSFSGRSLCARSRRASCRPSGSWAQTLRAGVHGPPPLWSDCVNLAGSTIAPSRSSIAGRRDAPSALPSSRPSSSGARSTSLSRTEPAVPAVKQATSVIPIVFALAIDPVGGGLVASLARPGGNVTGLSVQATDLAGKRLELLREVVPESPPVGNHGQCWHCRKPCWRWARSRPRLARSASKSRHSKSGARKISLPPSRRSRPKPTHFTSWPILVSANRTRIITLALGARLPTIFDARDHVQAGALMSYGPNFPDLVPAHRRLCRQDFAWGEARRYPGRAADQIRSRRSISRQPRRSGSPFRKRSRPAPTR